MATAYFAPFGKFQARSVSGSSLHPGVGWKLWTYAAGTVTPLATYKDRNQAATNTNPVILDANGEADVWLSSAAYKFVLTDAANVTQWTEDNIHGPEEAGVSALFQTQLADTTNPAYGDALIGMKRTLAGAVASTQHQVNEYRIVNPVSDFGCPTDGTSNCSTAVQAAIDSLGGFGTIEFPAGTFKFNVMTTGRVGIRGAGLGKTLIQSFATGQAAIVYAANLTWDFATIEDLLIQGATGTVTELGVQFGRTTYVLNDEFAGRVVFRNVKFRDLDKCIYRPYGNIGIYLYNCSFENANFHIWSHGQASPLMHAGALIAYSCHFQLSKLASIYVDSPTSGTGMISFNDCVFESNSGFEFFVKNFNDVAIGSPFLIKNCWSEANYTSASVTIDAVVYTPPKQLYAANVFHMIFEDCNVGTMTLVSSNVVTNRCHLDFCDPLLDTASTLTHHESYNDLTNLKNGYRTSVGGTFRAAPNGCPVTLSLRHAISEAYGPRVIYQEVFPGVTAFAGVGAKSTTDASDGVLQGQAICQDLVCNPGDNIYTAASVVNIQVNKFYVWYIIHKLVSGLGPTMVINSATQLAGTYVLSQDRWTCTGGIVSTVGMAGLPAAVAFRYSGNAGGTGTIRLAAHALVEFATLQEALEFINNPVHAVPITTHREIRAAAAPTVGTWSLADIAWNTAPASAGPIGWVCTLAGVPGTWKAFGTIA